MPEKKCQYNTLRRSGKKTIIVNCRNCKFGNSTIFDKTCRQNIFKIIQIENTVNCLILNHAYVKVFQGKELEILKDLNTFLENIKAYTHLKLPSKNNKKCKDCNLNRYKKIKTIIEKSNEDPFKGYLLLKDFYEETINHDSFCEKCNQEFKKIVEEMLSKGKINRHIKNNKVDRELFYRNYIRPYVRPGFIDSYIQLDPPPDAIFLESYEITRDNRRPMNVTHYTLKSRPEKLYFVIPSEYELPHEELFLLEKVRSYLSSHRPKDASFMDAESAREYFQKLGKKIITRFMKEEKMELEMNRLDYLSDVFSRYSAGFGIIEDLLLDNRIQDVYVNAPVENNPLHIVVDGEEYTSNIFLSNGDIDALASRFRTLSGRAFSEASPVLDMDLEAYHTRVAAISNPLTPKGIALHLEDTDKNPGR